MAIDFDKLKDAAETEQKETLDLIEFKKTCDKWSKIIGEIDATEVKLKALKAEECEYSEDKIPTMLEKGGIKKLPLSDGRTIEVNEELYVSLPKKRAAEIMADIRKRKSDDIIKNVITIPIEKGKDNVAGEIVEKATELGLDPERSETVAPQTYKKWLKTRIEKGESVDLSFYGAYQMKKAKLSQ